MNSLLTEKLFEYCHEKGLKYQKSNARYIDFDLWKNGVKIGAIVKDWNRALGYNVVCQADWSKKDYHFSQVIILTNKCSYPAKRLGEKINIPIFRHWDPIKIKETE